jgi:hypothetical protein
MLDKASSASIYFWQFWTIFGKHLRYSWKPMLFDFYIICLSQNCSFSAIFLEIITLTPFLHYFTARPKTWVRGPSKNRQKTDSNWKFKEGRKNERKNYCNIKITLHYKMNEKLHYITKLHCVIKWTKNLQQTFHEMTSEWKKLNLYWSNYIKCIRLWKLRSKSYEILIIWTCY